MEQSTPAGDAVPAPAEPSHGRPEVRRRAAGIYGTIITAAVLAAAGTKLPTWELAVSVFTTLLVYWLAEQYAQLMAELPRAGQLPQLAAVRGSLAATWPMVSVSYLPLLSLLAAWAAGASEPGAANVALVVTLCLLLYEGWSAGRASDLRGSRLVAVTVVAGALGAVMVLLKATLAHHW